MNPTRKDYAPDAVSQIESDRPTPTVPTLGTLTDAFGLRAPIHGADRDLDAGASAASVVHGASSGTGVALTSDGCCS
jgi:hypothetical protein